MQKYNVQKIRNEISKINYKIDVAAKVIGESNDLLWQCPKKMDEAKLTEAQQKVEIGVRKEAAAEIKSWEHVKEKEAELKHNFSFNNFFHFWNNLPNPINLVWMKSHWEMEHHIYFYWRKEKWIWKKLKMTFIICFLQKKLQSVSPNIESLHSFLIENLKSFFWEKCIKMFTISCFLTFFSQSY